MPKRREYLKITWLSSSRPQEIEEFWNAAYPEIDTAANKIKQLEKHDFTLVGYFYLSQDSWTETYYKPLQERFENFLKRHKNSELARQVVEENQAEIELYQKFKDYSSYGFYLARKN